MVVKGSSLQTVNRKIEIYSDGADLAAFQELSNKPYIRGFTTNPTLMRKAGVKNYCVFAKQVMSIIGKKPISFEVFADNPLEIEKQARIISNWGSNVFVKIPIVNSKGKRLLKTIKKLHGEGIRLNITAVLTIEQLTSLNTVINQKTPCIISVFAGRIADTGRNPIPVIKKACYFFLKKKNVKILWASTREVLNIYQAISAGADIITVTNDIIKKYIQYKALSLAELSRQTSKMFYFDAKRSGYMLQEKES